MQRLRRKAKRLCPKHLVGYILSQFFYVRYDARCDEVLPKKRKSMPSRKQVRVAVVYFPGMNR